MNEVLPVGTPIGLTNCDREPIHAPEGIQPIGFMLVVAADWIVQRAANTAAFIGHAPQAVLGKPLADIVSADAMRLLRERVRRLRKADAMERVIDIALVDGQPPFDLALHMVDGSIVVEAEPSLSTRVDSAGMISATIARLSGEPDVSALLRDGAEWFRDLVGFDRVMIYRFSRDGSGEVVAQSLKDGIDGFLGLNFPATDIPKQARALYLRNRFRIVADVQREPAPLVSHPQAKPFDMSMALYRAVSPIHLEYLRNMGVCASLSVSLVVEGEMWGMLVCHHYSPRLPGFAARSTAELFGHLFSLQLERALQREERQYEDRARRIGDRLMASAAQDSSLLNDAQWFMDVVGDAIPNDGVGVFMNGDVSLTGMYPPGSAFMDIVDALNRQDAQAIYTTERIEELVPSAADHAETAAGMLAIPISLRPRDYIVLFRSEKPRSVRWAGDQAKTVEQHGDEMRLSPRKSFEAWSQLKRGEAEPFRKAELRIAESLRTTLLEVVLQMSEAAGEERRRASEQQKLLIAELNHRVRNILSLIRALMGQTKRDSGSMENALAKLDSRIRALASAHDQLTAENWVPASLRDLIETELDAFVSVKRSAVKLNGPNVSVVPEAYTILALVLHEMVTNAAKYGALSDNGSLSIDWFIDERGYLVIDWCESGGPAVQAPKRQGFGTTIINRSIPHELGGEASVEYRTGGVVARFEVPPRHFEVTEDKAIQDQSEPSARKGNGQDSIAGRSVLLVEDSMIIALDAEDVLRDAGASEVHVAASVSAAQAIIESEELDSAVLDVNLGNETSIGIAEALQDKGVPFIFASGYGADDIIPERFRSIQLVMKPYTGDALQDALAAALAG